MRLDNIPKYRILWYEDSKGNELDFDINDGFPDFSDVEGEVYQHCESAVVSYSICVCNSEPGEDKWPVKFLKWLINKLPRGWKARTGPSGRILGGEATINCVYPIVKYLVEQRDWRFPQACVAASNLCERCLNLTLWEVEGEDLSQHQHYLDTCNTHCIYCKYIDFDHHAKCVPKALYRAYARGDDLEAEYNLMLKERMHDD